ncbi:Y+L amino acid transporter 2-like isoform X1 [Haemaphysalis longicornis]
MRQREFLQTTPGLQKDVLELKALDWRRLRRCVIDGPRQEMKRTKYKILADQEEWTNSADEATCSLLTEEARDDTRELTLRREVGLFSSITLLLGSIIGTGIFITPGNVLKNSKFIGLDLLLWAVAGLNAIMAGLCEAELGALLPASGGDYAFFLAAGQRFGPFGDVPAFLYSWTFFLVDPAATSVQGLTFSAYVLSLPYPQCKPPYIINVLVTALYITLSTAVNCFSVEVSTRVQDLFSGLKCGLLIAIIATGAVHSLKENHLWDVWPSEDKPSVGEVSSALYSALYCYTGWGSITAIAEEVKNPGRNIPIAIAVSVVLTTVIYLLTNVAFFIVLEALTIMDTDAVGVAFARKTWGHGMAAAMPFVIAVTVFGTTSAGLFSSSRIFFAASRQGHLPAFMSYVNMKSSVPVPAVMVRCLIAVAFTLVGSVHFLIEVNILLFTIWEALGVVCLLLLRRSMPDAPRPYRIPTVVAYFRLTVTVVLVVVTFSQASRFRYQYGVVVLVVTAGCVYYHLFVTKKIKIPGGELFSVFLQKLFYSAPCVLDVTAYVHKKERKGSNGDVHNPHAVD